MILRQDITGCFADVVGQAGANKFEYQTNFERTAAIFEEILANYQSHFTILNAADDLAKIGDVANQITNNYRHLLIIGTGGSTNNARAICSLAKNYTKRISFLENIDPDTVTNCFDNLDTNNTAYLIISKSGETLETIALTLALIEFLKSKNIPDLSNKLFCITGDSNNVIRKIMLDMGAHILPHNKDIGGRYAIFTNAGLLPAAVAGLDIAKVRQGAVALINQDNQAGGKTFLQSAALLATFVKQKKPIAIMMPYIDRLVNFSSWHRQLWAESIGKSGYGMTPVRAVGTIDQHSQLQLYLDGPKDKLFTVITSKHKNDGIELRTNDSSIKYMNGKTIGDLLDASSKAAILSIKNSGSPLRHIEIERLDEFSFGALSMHFTLETIISAFLIGINPFDQPAVENCKKLAVANLEA